MFSVLFWWVLKAKRRIARLIQAAAFSSVGCNDCAIVRQTGDVILEHDGCPCTAWRQVQQSSKCMSRPDRYISLMWESRLPGSLLRIVCCVCSSASLLPFLLPYDFLSLSLHLLVTVFCEFTFGLLFKRFADGLTNESLFHFPTPFRNSNLSFALMRIVETIAP